jgi:hypothetical protein
MLASQRKTTLPKLLPLPTAPIGIPNSTKPVNFEGELTSKMLANDIPSMKKQTSRGNLFQKPTISSASGKSLQDDPTEELVTKDLTPLPFKRERAETRTIRPEVNYQEPDPPKQELSKRKSSLNNEVPSSIALKQRRKSSLNLYFDEGGEIIMQRQRTSPIPMEDARTTELITDEKSEKGHMINQYLFIKTLGQGMYGKVKLAKNVDTGAMVVSTSSFQHSFIRPLR